MSHLSTNFLPALIQALILVILRVFTIPWRIWNGAVKRLAQQRAQASSADSSLDTEFPVLEWFKTAWDGIIMLTWVIGPVLVFIVAIGVAQMGYGSAFGLFFGSFVGGLIYLYFSVIGISMLKEFLTMALSVALNIEKMARHSEKVPTVEKTTE